MNLGLIPLTGSIRVDYTGKVFNRLTVMGLSANRKYGRLAWLCKCECGNHTLAITEEVRSCRLFSCGCVRKQRDKTRSAHLYKRWYSMMRRVEPGSKHRRIYADKGITVCPRWQSYENFKADMQDTFKPDLTLDRINNAKGYSPENCRWADWAVQANNRDVCRYYTLHDKTLTVNQWAAFSGIGIGCLRRRLNTAGWAFKDAITLPVRHGVEFKPDFTAWLLRHQIGDAWEMSDVVVAFRRGGERKVVPLGAAVIGTKLRKELLGIVSEIEIQEKSKAGL